MKQKQQRFFKDAEIQHNDVGAEVIRRVTETYSWSISETSLSERAMVDNSERREPTTT